MVVMVITLTPMMLIMIIQLITITMRIVVAAVVIDNDKKVNIQRNKPNRTFQLNPNKKRFLGIG
jgi:hypothetical protein